MGEREGMPQEWDLSGSIREPKGHLLVHPWCEFEKQIVVATTRLNRWTHEEGIRVADWMWIDVQGAKSDVIRGCSGVLRNPRFLYDEYRSRALRNAKHSYSYADNPQFTHLRKALAPQVVEYLGNVHWFGAASAKDIE